MHEEKEHAPSLLKQLWVLIVGCIFGGVTLAFLMMLVLLGIFGLQVPCEARFLVIAVVAFGAALSAAFLGGGASARGALPIPGAEKNPVVVGVTGGVAVLVIMFLLLPNFFSEAQCQQQQVASNDRALEIVAWVVLIPSTESRVEAYEKLCGCKASEAVVKLLVSFSATGEASSDAQATANAIVEAQTPEEAQEIVASHSNGACRGTYRFSVSDGHLSCLNGEPIPQYVSPNQGERMADVKVIVLHRTGTNTTQGTIQAMISPQLKISAHALVSQSGTVVQLVGMQDAAFHAGMSSWNGLNGLNTMSIGIELVGLLEDAPTPAQLEATKALIRTIRDSFGNLPVVRHSDVSERRSDPGPAFPWTEFCSEIVCDGGPNI